MIDNERHLPSASMSLTSADIQNDNHGWTLSKLDHMFLP